MIYGAAGESLFDITIPCPVTVNQTAPPPEAGWSIREGRAYFNGEAVALRGRSLDVLRVLVEKDAVGVDNLRAAWGCYQAEDSTIRWQVGKLKKELRKLFPDFEGEVIETTGNGYRLTIR